MSGRRSPRLHGVRARAFAKLNLGLVVGPRRPDGYHDLVTVFQTVSLHDTLWVTPRARGFSLRLRGECGAERSVPDGGENMVLRAARRVAEATALRGGAHFVLAKRIPAGAGLGGGSSDAAAALRALLRLYGVRLRPEEKRELALSLGSDVPFFLRGGTALGLGRGEQLKPLRLARDFVALVVVPPWRSQTREAFNQLKRKKLTLTAKRSLTSFIRRVSWSPFRAETAMRIGNSFEEVILGPHGENETIRRRLLAGGALGARLTGSGSAVFGVFGPRASLFPLVESVGQEGNRIYLVTPTRVGASLRSLS